MIVNFNPDMKFRLQTTYGEAVLELLRSGKDICIAVEHDGETLLIKASEFAGIKSVVRGADGRYQWPINAADGNEYQAVMELPENTPQIIEIPALRARYFAELSGGLIQAGGRREIGRLSGR